LGETHVKRSSAAVEKALFAAWRVGVWISHLKPVVRRTARHQPLILSVFWDELVVSHCARSINVRRSDRHCFRRPYSDGRTSGRIFKVTSPALGAAAVKEALKRSGVGADQVDEVIMGCVLPAGLGQAPARQAALGAGCRRACPASPSTKCAVPA
jgi:hypothetical protein